MSGTIVETIRHKKKGSTLVWFIIGIVPILDLYFLWKAAEVIASHEKVSVEESKILP